MDTYRTLIFNKDDKKIIDSIKRKLRKYPHKGYKKDCFKYFTDGIIYYHGRKIMGFVLLEFHIDEPSKSLDKLYSPNYIDILIKFYKTDEIMDALLKSIDILFEQYHFTYIKGWPINYNEYLIFKNNNFYIYNHYAIDSQEVLSMRKMVDDDKNNYWLSKGYTLNLEECPENSICRQIVENRIL